MFHQDSPSVGPVRPRGRLRGESEIKIRRNRIRRDKNKEIKGKKGKLEGQGRYTRNQESGTTWSEICQSTENLVQFF